MSTTSTQKSQTLTDSTGQAVTRVEWIEARKALLAREKAFMRERDAISAARRDLPRVRVDKSYVFEESSGKRELVDLFEGKSQLIVYHFMFNPSWDEGCRGCSYVVDHFGGALPHLGARDTALAVISRAPLAKLEAFKKRMGWTFRWLSSSAADFDYDYHVAFRPEEIATGSVEHNFTKMAFQVPEKPGLSVFIRDGQDVFHTYSTYERGLDALMGTYTLLDLTPLGRQENGSAMGWLRHHDRYSAA